MSWPKVEFERLYEIPSKNGLTRPALVRGEGYKMINMGELFANDWIGDIDMERVPMNEKELSNMLVEEGDLLFARQSLVLSGAGKCSIVTHATEQTTFESHIIRVRLEKTKANPNFYHYYFKSPNCNIRSIVTQGVQAGIRGNELKKLEVHFPPIETQNKIAAILESYNNLIENNQRRIQLLEQSALLLYKEWFVHLRFPGHEHVKINDGVPEGWERVVVPDIIEINPKEKVINGDDIKYIPMSCLSNTGMVVDISEMEIRQKSTSVKFKKHDVLFARITPCLENGKTGYVNFLKEDEVACGSTEFIVLRGIKVSPFFTYCLSRTHDFRENAIKSMIGSSGRQRVQVSCFSEYEIGLPGKVLLEQFDVFALSCFEQISCLVRQNNQLKKALDLLLPKLMSGEIPV